MKKSEKKAELKRMMAEFFTTSGAEAMTKLRNDVLYTIGRLPMSSGDRNVMEEAMDLWTYNTDRYIKNTKSVPAKGSVTADFEAILKTVDNSLLSN